MIKKYVSTVVRFYCQQLIFGMISCENALKRLRILISVFEFPCFSKNSWKVDCLVPIFLWNSLIDLLGKSQFFHYRSFKTISESKWILNFGKITLSVDILAFIWGTLTLSLPSHFHPKFAQTKDLSISLFFSWIVQFFFWFYLEFPYESDSNLQKLIQIRFTNLLAKRTYLLFFLVIIYFSYSRRWIFKSIWRVPEVQ